MVQQTSICVDMLSSDSVCSPPGGRLWKPIDCTRHSVSILSSMLTRSGNPRSLMHQGRGFLLLVAPDASQFSVVSFHDFSLATRCRRFWRWRRSYPLNPQIPQRPTRVCTDCNPAQIVQGPRMPLKPSAIDRQAQSHLIRYATFLCGEETPPPNPHTDT